MASRRRAHSLPSSFTYNTSSGQSANAVTNAATPVLLMRPGQLSSPGSFFCLPVEIRQMIYAYLIPKKKVFIARGKYQAPPRHPATPKQWELHCLKEFHVYVSQFHVHENQAVFIPAYIHLQQPALTQTCAETRDYMLQVGSFIFKRNPDEGGLWWNPQLDTLAFNWRFEPRFEKFALLDLTGLDQVHHICMDAHQAQELSYRVHYSSDEGGAMSPKSQDIDKVELGFLGRANDDDGHFLPLVFPQMQSLSVSFIENLRGSWPLRDDIHQDFGDCLYATTACKKCIRFNLGVDDEDTVKKNLADYKLLWTHCGDLFNLNMDPFHHSLILDFDWDSVSPIDYFTKAGREIKGGRWEIHTIDDWM